MVRRVKTNRLPLPGFSAPSLFEPLYIIQCHTAFEVGLRLTFRSPETWHGKRKRSAGEMETGIFQISVLN